MSHYEKTFLDGVMIITPNIHEDKRGCFFESFNSKEFNSNGIDLSFVQDNHSKSSRNTLRGLHFQKKNPQGKLVRCTRGEVFDVVVDIDPKSNNFKKSFSIILSEENNLQLWIPPGYAHGFCVLSEEADFQYKCTDFYYPSDQFGIIWNDPEINIDWPLDAPIISDKDSLLPTLEEYLK